MINLLELYAYVEEKMKYAKVITTDNKAKQIELNKIHDFEQLTKLKATDGSDQARESTKNRIFFILSEMKDEINAATASDIIKQYHVDYFKNIYTNDNATYVKKPIDKEIEGYFQKYSLAAYDNFEKKLNKLTQIVYQEIYGFSILDELIFDSDFNEVACNRFDYIWIQYKGLKKRIPNIKFRFINADYYNKIIENRIASTSKVEMNAGEPIIYSTLINGSRVTALRDPLSRYMVGNVRLFNYKNISSEDRNKFMEEKMMKIVSLLTSKGRRNAALIGEMGSGKTTAADEIIIKNLDDDLAIGLGENIFELNISSKYPNKNIVELQYSQKHTPSEIVEIFFRLNRDVVIFGEVRSHMEAFEMINAMLRQARGSLFTFHSSSVKRMIHDLRKLLMRTGFYTDYREARFDVADAIDLVIHIKLDRSTGNRNVYKLSEVIANEEDMNYSIKDLFIYDKEKNKYLINKEGLHPDTLLSCLEYEMTRSDVNLLKELFVIKDGEEHIFEYMEDNNVFTKL